MTSCALRQVPMRQNYFLSEMCESLTRRWNYFTINGSSKGRVWGNSDRRLVLKGIIFITFLWCGMLRGYYLSLKQYLVILKCYLRFTGCSSMVWINVHWNFHFIFFVQSKKDKCNKRIKVFDWTLRYYITPFSGCHLHTLRVFCVSPHMV